MSPPEDPLQHALGPSLLVDWLDSSELLHREPAGSFELLAPALLLSVLALAALALIRSVRRRRRDAAATVVDDGSGQAATTSLREALVVAEQQYERAAQQREAEQLAHTATKEEQQESLAAKDSAEASLAAAQAEREEAVDAMAALREELTAAGAAAESSAERAAAAVAASAAALKQTEQRLKVAQQEKAEVSRPVKTSRAASIAESDGGEAVNAALREQVGDLTKQSEAMQDELESARQEQRQARAEAVAHAQTAERAKSSRAGLKVQLEAAAAATAHANEKAAAAHARELAAAHATAQAQQAALRTEMVEIRPSQEDVLSVRMASHTDELSSAKEMARVASQEAKKATIWAGEKEALQQATAGTAAALAEARLREETALSEQRLMCEAHKAEIHQLVSAHGEALADARDSVARTASSAESALRVELDELVLSQTAELVTEKQAASAEQAKASAALETAHQAATDAEHARLQSIVKKVAQRMMNGLVSAALVAWVEWTDAKASNRRVVKRVVKRLQQIELAGALGRWHERTVWSVSSKAIVARLVARCQKGRAVDVFSGWAAWSSDQVQARQAEAAAGAQQSMREAHAAELDAAASAAAGAASALRAELEDTELSLRAEMDSLAARHAETFATEHINSSSKLAAAAAALETAYRVAVDTEAARLQSIVKKVAQRMTHGLSSAALLAWVDWVNKQTHNRRVVKHVVARLKQIALAGAFDRWQEHTAWGIHSRIIVTRVVARWQKGQLVDVLLGWLTWSSGRVAERKEQERLIGSRMNAKQAVDAEDRIRAGHEASLEKIRIEMQSAHDVLVAQMSAEWAAHKAVMHVEHAKLRAEHAELRRAGDLSNNRVIQAMCQRLVQRSLVKCFTAWQAWSQQETAAEHVVRKQVKMINTVYISSAFTSWQSWSLDQRRVTVVTARMLALLAQRCLTRHLMVWQTWTLHAIAAERLVVRMAKRITTMRTISTFAAWRIYIQLDRRSRRICQQLVQRLEAAWVSQLFGAWRIHSRQMFRTRQMALRRRSRVTMSVFELWIGLVAHRRHLSSPAHEVVYSTPTQPYATADVPSTASSLVFDSPATPAKGTSSVEQPTARKLQLTPARLLDEVEESNELRLEPDLVEEYEAPTGRSPLHDAFHVKQKQRKVLYRVMGRLLHPELAKAFARWDAHCIASLQEQVRIQRGVRGARHWDAFALRPEEPEPEPVLALKQYAKQAPQRSATRGLNKGLNGGVTPESLQPEPEPTPVVEESESEPKEAPLTADPHTATPHEMLGTMGAEPATLPELLAAPSCVTFTEPAEAAAVPMFVPFAHSPVTKGVADALPTDALPTFVPFAAAPEPAPAANGREYGQANERLMALKHRNHTVHHPSIYQSSRPERGEKGTRTATEGAVAMAQAWAKDQKQRKQDAVAGGTRTAVGESQHNAFKEDFKEHWHELDLPEVKLGLDDDVVGME